MPLNVGSRIAHYDVTAKIGEGGMGEVYRATDTKLDRDVALKVLPRAFTDDPDRLARFEREAKVLASLNHPNIGHIYGLEEAEGQKALVLELVEGPTLAERIKQGPISVDEALPIAKQIAEALEAAHEQGVIHRDLKPANVKVKEDGTVKVLDFGLAKALSPEPEGDPSQSPTLTAAATQMGVIMGTAAYMSPEQARGKPVDKRADIWSFGVVLYEMLTGQRAFQGEDVSLTLSAVLQREPDLDLLPEKMSPTLRTYLRRCLAKDPRERVRDIGDVRLAMEGVFETTRARGPEGLAAPVGLWTKAAWMAAGCLVAGLGGIAAWNAASGGPVFPWTPGRFVVTIPDGVSLNNSGTSGDVAVSPDGERIVFVSTAPEGALYLRELGGIEAVLLRGTEGAREPFFSPDGEWIGFFDGPDSALKRISVLGGQPQMLCDCDVRLSRGATWGPNDTVVFATDESDGLLRVRVGGGQPERLTTLNSKRGEVAHTRPEFLPNGTGVLFATTSGSVASSSIALVRIDTGEVSYLLAGGTQPRYAPSGHIVYGGDGMLRAAAFDLDRLEITDSSPVSVLDNVRTKLAGSVDFSFSQDGSLVFVTGQAVGGDQRTLEWIDRAGVTETLGFPPNGYLEPRVSPDGTRLAVAIQDFGDIDIWLGDLPRGTLTKLTNSPQDDRFPLWTPDGGQLVFSSFRNGSPAILRMSMDGGGVEQLLLMEDADSIVPYDWSADGKQLVFEYEVDGDHNVGILSMESGQEWEPLLNTVADERSPAISSDGQWIAYHSDQTGIREVYVQRFPELGGLTQITQGTGVHPTWSRSGHELVYRTARSATPPLLGVAVELDTTVRVGATQVLVEGPYYATTVAREYDTSPDGGRFIRVRRGGLVAPEDAAKSQIILIQDWFSELERLVPTD